MKDDGDWVEDTDGQYTFSRKRKRGANKKLEFVGWGSRTLIEFLDSVGTDTSKTLTQHEVTVIVREYIRVNNLPLKKKRVLCDDKLYTLFGKSVSRLKIYDALEKHFAENHDESEDEEDSSEEDGDGMLSGKGKKTATLGKKLSQGKTNQTSKSCFAAVIPENIKHVYLKKSLVLQLVDIPDDFEEKIVDSFVRIKSDRDDYLQKLPYHLEQVTGLKRASEVGNGRTEIQLLVTNSIIGVPLKMLSDDNFTEEECVDLHERIKAGLVKRPTVVELSAKAEILHKDIINHWIPREIALLQKLIDRANEKGWRKELYEYLQRRQLLKTDAEQQRLLLQMPEVVAQELESVDPPAISVDNSIGVEGNGSSPKSTLRGVSETSSHDASGMIDGCNVPQSAAGMIDACDVPQSAAGMIDVCDVPQSAAGMIDACDVPQSAAGMIDGFNVPQSAAENGELDREDQHVLKEEDGLIKDSQNSQGAVSQKMPEKQGISITVIELSDDEEVETGIQNLNDIPVLQEEVEKPDDRRQYEDLGAEGEVWYYADPQNQTQGPFTIQSLKTWNDQGYFPPQFKIWREGQNKEQAVVMEDVIYNIFLQRLF